LLRFEQSIPSQECKVRRQNGDVEEGWITHAVIALRGKHYVLVRRDDLSKLVPSDDFLILNPALIKPAL
jgi:hypothetical protein